MTSISSVAGSAALTILSNINQTNSSAPSASKSASSVAEIVASLVSGAGRAEKTVSSSIFNAVANSLEQAGKPDAAIDDMLKYVDDNYTNFEKTFPYAVATARDKDGMAKNIQEAKETGEKLKQLILANPAEMKQKLAAIKSSQPNLSPDGAMSVLTFDLVNKLSGGRQTTPIDSASASMSETATTLVNEIQSQMRIYHLSLSAQQDAASRLDLLDGLSSNSASLKAMAEIDPERAATLQASNDELAARLSEGTKVSALHTSIVAGISDRINDLTDRLSKVAKIEGNILSRQSDGHWDYGQFSVKDKSGSVTLFANQAA